MPTEEAQRIYEQAIKLVYGDSEDKRSQRDGAAMLLIALERAGGPFPDAESELAMAYWKLGNNYESKTHADRALKADPNQFTAQFVKTGCALESLPGFFATQKVKSEMEKLVVVFENCCRQDRSAELFLRCTNNLMKIADLVKDEGISTLRAYKAIANVPIDQLVCENGEQRAEAQRLSIIAQGRQKI